MPLSPFPQIRFTLTVCALIALAAARVSLVAQTTRQVVRDAAGAVACVVRVPDSRSATPDADPLIIDIRVPARPADALLARLPVSRRDYSQLPIRVFLVPAPRRGDPTDVKLPRVNPIAADLSPRALTEEPSPDGFVRVQYARSDLRGGVDLVAERTAATDSGERLTTQTRCRILGTDALVWR